MSRKKLVIGGIVAVLAIGIIGAAAGSPDEPEPSKAPVVAVESPVVTEAPVVDVTPEPTAEPEPTATPEPEDDLTASQRNAIDKAESYLAYTAFSRSGLIDQLVFEDFPKADAEFAVDALDVDWDEQAYLKALSYLEYGSFSLSGLIDQLEFEGFSKSQAKYGATKAYNE